MKKPFKLVPFSVVLVLCLGMFLLPSKINAGENTIAGNEILQPDLASHPDLQLSRGGELPCDGTRYDLETPVYYGYYAGPGAGRAIGFQADEDFTISSVGILGELYYQSFDVVIYDSPDGHTAGSVLYSTSYATGGTGYGWNDMPVSFSFSAGNFYVLNWRPSDCNYDWVVGLEYYNDSGLPFDAGPLTILEGIEGCDAENYTNFLHINFRICVEGGGMPWDFCFYDENYYVTELWISLYSPGYIYGQAMYDSPSFPAPITGIISSGKAYFAIGYRADGGLRFYDINLPDRDGMTWGVYSDTGEFYDYPHSAQLQPCGAEPQAWGEALNGAVK